MDVSKPRWNETILQRKTLPFSSAATGSCREFAARVQLASTCGSESRAMPQLHLPLASAAGENHQLIQQDPEDIEVFLNSLEPSSNVNNVSTSSPASQTTHSSVSTSMFQNSMPAMSVHSAPPTYHPDATNAFMHAGGSPVYVPTTRAVLPVQYGSAQPAAQTQNVWQMQPETAYTASTTHPSMSPRFTFPPTPSPPISSPAGRTETYGTALGVPGRPGTISPYTTYVSPDITPWNFNQSVALHSSPQGLQRRPTAAGKTHHFMQHVLCYPYFLTTIKW